ncbi:unnamed protein product [Bursaphelenchus okinawaensis]|uniref:Fungal lipase-type domain-containing protein n=1 Tax=Bursaphelenchus okinawaensis TaxID=465554 RepID=A0A811KLA6_9BILA|nr:unnamed protein product [Bursaphelenchus okinawaensis]CAG9105597.1 unnamed protein product [Bursaphelenchus okinawaensis]
MYCLPILIFLLSLQTSYSELSSEFSTEKAIQYYLLTGGTYTITPQPCVDKALDADGDWKIIAHNNSIVCDSWNQTCGYLVVQSDVYKQIIVTYKGSVGEQVTELVGYTFVPRQPLGAGRVHLYMYLAQNATWPTISAILNDTDTADYDVIFSGHSLGGAEAVISAVRVVDEGIKDSSQVQVWTYGQPRVGNAPFSNNFDELFPTSYRVVNRKDIVPHVPPCDAKLLKQCWPAVLGYYHQSTEVWYYDGFYAENSTYRISTEPEDPNGSNSLIFDYDAADHAGEDGYLHFDPQVYGLSNCADEYWPG